MRFKLLGLMAALLLVAGCAEDAADSGTDTGGGTEVSAAPPPPPPPPAAPPPAMDPQEYFVINVGDRVFFDFDKSDLRPDAIDQLNRQADFLKMNGSITVVVEGHCDERGTREYNLGLGERRGNAVSGLMSAQGGRGDQLATVSYGEERPTCRVSDEDCWSMNRRVEIVYTAR